jgi:predicted HTH domain antitoxin
MHLVIEDETLAAARMSAEKLKLELAILLYGRERLTLGQAARVAGVGQWQFQQTLAARCIETHYDQGELNTDLMVLDRLGRR